MKKIVYTQKIRLWFNGFFCNKNKMIRMQDG